MVIDVKPLQPENARSPIEVTELGITVFLHPNISVLVADSTIALQLFLESYTVFPLSTTMVVKPLQELNAQSPIEVTELGMVIDVKPLQPANAQLPIEVTELGITVFLHPDISVLVADSTIALQLFLESYTLFPLSTTMVVKPQQEINAQLPIEVTELGMVIDVKP